jgi:hypothetical protein
MYSPQPMKRAAEDRSAATVSTEMFPLLGMEEVIACLRQFATVDLRPALKDISTGSATESAPRRTLSES